MNGEKELADTNIEVESTRSLCIDKSCFTNQFSKWILPIVQNCLEGVKTRFCAYLHTRIKVYPVLYESRDFLLLFVY